MKGLGIGQCGIAVALAILALSGGCRARTTPDPPFRLGQALVHTAQHGPVQATLTIKPDSVHLEHDLLLTLTLEAPPDVKLERPSLAGRIQGFEIGGLFDESQVVDGRKRIGIFAKLTPVPAFEYRIAPIVIAYASPGGPSQWFHTPPVVLPQQPLIEGQIPSEVRNRLRPLGIAPAPATLILIGLGVLTPIALCAALLMTLPRLRRALNRVTLTPRERALREIEALLGRDLIGAGLIKQFYIELTLIVRRYIEREHRIRAPEQTTEEFLATAIDDRRFPAGTLDLLRAFLESADLVKFAGRNVTADEIASAIATARRYLEGEIA